MPEKIVRDVVHDVIAFRMEVPVDRLLFHLINAAEMQRLRRIRQLGLTSLAYPGADHSRYSHSLGVMETTRRMLSQLELDFRIDPYQRTVCLAAALLHDLGHGPFSHVFERVSGIEHEAVTCRMILDPSGEVHRLLVNHHPSLPHDITEMLCHRPRSFLSDVISSQLDADRFDYLLRDNLMTGSRYGDYDLNWLLHALAVDTVGNRLVVHAKGVSAIEAFLQSRYHMYRNVYFHKVVRTAEGMVRLVLQRAKRLAVQGRLIWPAPEDAVHSALLGRQLTLQQFTDLDDVSVLHCFKQWAGESDAVLARLCRGLLYRRLYKVIELPVDLSRAETDTLLMKVRDVVAGSGGDPDYDLFYDEPADTPYDLAEGEERGEGEHVRQIAVLDEQGKVVPFATLSSLPAALNRQLFFRRVHVADAYEVLAKQVVK